MIYTFTVRRSVEFDLIYDNGDLVLTADSGDGTKYCVLRIMPNGTFRRHRHLPKNTGISVDEDGKIQESPYSK